MVSDLPLPSLACIKLTESLAVCRKFAAVSPLAQVSAYRMRAKSLASAYGASQLAIISSGVTPDNIPYRFGKCCTTGTVPVNSPGPNADCANVSRKRNELAFDLATRPVRRGATDDPLRQMTFREDSWRTRLSPHLLADYLLNDFQMEYR